MKGEVTTLADVQSLHVECAECGRERWLRSRDLAQKLRDGPATKLEDVYPKLFCDQCRGWGLPGKNVVVDARSLSALAASRSPSTPCSVSPGGSGARLWRLASGSSVG